MLLLFLGRFTSGKGVGTKVFESNEFRYETEVDSLTTDSLVYMPVAMSRRWGKGEVILVSTPLIFTNYGMLDGKNATYIFRLLSQMGEASYRSHGGVHERNGTGAAISLSVIFWHMNRFAGRCI